MFKIIFVILALLLTSAPSYAATKLTKDQQQLIDNAKDYLAKVKTISARFIQTNPGNAEISSGEIFISKPGHLKMSYTEPFQIDYYVNDSDLTQYDHELDEVSRGSAPNNPLKILLYDGVNITNNELMEVTNVTDDGNNFSIYLLTKNKDIREISGLVLKFRKLPIELAGIERVDSEGNKTETNFSSVEINKEINSSVFNFVKPKAAFPKQPNK